MQIVLRPAYVWDCPECGREVFVRGIVPEMADEDLVALREEHGIEPWEEGDFVMLPETVVCPECSASFETMHFKDA
jgi:hypothetical protein